MGENIALSNRQALEIIGQRYPGATWASESDLVISRDETSVTWIHAPSGINHLIVSFALECNLKWAKSIRGRLKLWMVRRNSYPFHFISIDEGQLNLRVWARIIQTNIETLDPTWLIGELRTIGQALQAESYLR